VLLTKRPATGIWGGLWTFPEIIDAATISDYCSTYLSLSADAISELTPFQHVFSHFKLNIQPFVISTKHVSKAVNENNTFNWYKIDDALTLGLPAPVKTVLTSL
jgi:A/G-specific adenine glycosylase